MKPIAPVRLKTARLVLRETCEEDLDALVTLANDYEVAVRLATMPHPYTREDGRSYLDAVVPNRASWSILAEHGFVGVVSVTPTENDKASPGLGYWLGRRHWGHGYATEAGAAVVDHCARSGLTELVSGYFAENPASGRVLTKLGFRRVGSHMHANPILGHDLEHVDMALTLSGRS